MFRATIFDYNGLLIDDEHVHLDAFRDVLHPLGIELGEAEYWDRYLGFDDVGAFEAVLRDHGRDASAEVVAGLVEAKRPRYLARAQGRLRAFPGAAELVRRRSERGPVLVVSGALRAEIELGLAELGVAALVGTIVSAEDTARGKPDPEGYLLAIAALTPLVGAEGARHAVVFEDSLSGIEAARAAGLPCVGVGHSYPLDDLRRAGASLVIPDLSAATEERLLEFATELGLP